MQECRRCEARYQQLDRVGTLLGLGLRWDACVARQLSSELSSLSRLARARGRGDDGMSALIR